eukprot:537808-Rhodomonas_salina.2
MSTRGMHTWTGISFGNRAGALSARVPGYSCIGTYSKSLPEHACTRVGRIPRNPEAFKNKLNDQLARPFFSANTGTVAVAQVEFGVKLKGGGVSMAFEQKSTSRPRDLAVKSGSYQPLW